MNNFTFSTVPNIVSEIGASNRLGELCRQYFPAAKRALIVTDPGFVKTGLLATPTQALEAAGFSVQLYSDVVADPPDSVILAAAEHARGLAVDLVIGFGGGSSMDVAKLIAVLVAGDQPLSTMYGIGNVQGTRLPLVQIPTTAGTGSEVTPISIVTTGAT
ncbi:MAG: alcohol dehydrogenase, partial [Paucimonas sp.]|nr:alcohol dehydrogenase [Paucimonas sp.]